MNNNYTATIYLPPEIASQLKSMAKAFTNPIHTMTVGELIQNIIAEHFKLKPFMQWAIPVPKNVPERPGDTVEDLDCPAIYIVPLKYKGEENE